MLLRFTRASRYVALGAAALLVPLCGLLPTTAGAAGPSIIISEVSAWGSGNSPYASDWFELTNTGSTSVPIAGWKMDDNSNSFASSVPLVGVASIAPGQSVIFTENSVAASFTSTWFGASPPPGLTIGTYTGSGVGLSTTADAVNIYDSTGTLIAGVSFANSPGAAPFKTFDNSAGLSGTISQLSSVGVNGAFAAANDANEVGSPGTNPPPPSTAVPEVPYSILLPASAIAALGIGIHLSRRRVAL